MAVIARARFNAASRLIKAVNRTILVEAGRGRMPVIEVTPYAPSTFEDVQREYRKALALGLPLRVSPEGLSGSIYGLDYDNALFRAAHDTLHAFTGHTFTHEGELALALLHCTRVAKLGEALGWHATTVRDAVALMWIDTAGQAEYFKATGGEFVGNQLAFAVEHFTAYLRATAGDVDPNKLGEA